MLFKHLPSRLDILKTTKKLDKSPFVNVMNGPRSRFGTRIWPPYKRDFLIKGYVIKGGK